MAHHIEYQIRRAIVTGYSLGAQHVLQPPLRDKEPTRRSNRKRIMSLGGVSFTNYNYGTTSWDIETTPLSASDCALMDMFLQSVEDGQVFTFDPYYAAGSSPSSRRAVVLEGEIYTPQRRVRRGGGGGNDRFVYAFRLLEVNE